MTNLPLTGAACTCRRGIERDNCPHCEGTGRAIDWRAYHAAKAATKPASIGDVLVFAGEPEGGNPYRSHGSTNPSLSGNARVLALRALRDGEDTSVWSYWFAPYGGGAVRITSAAGVRWDTAGSLEVRP